MSLPQNPMFSIATGVAQSRYGHKVIYCMHDDHFYLYKDGYYEQKFDIDLLGNICEHTDVINLNVQSYSSSVKKQILDHLKLLVRKPLSDFNINGYLNFPSGLYDISNNNFIPHSSDIISTIRLPYKYDLTATCPLWLKTLSEIFEVNTDHPENQYKIDLLQEFFGYCLTRDTRKEKALLLLGDGNTGKSTILEVLRYVLGDDNCSFVGLKYIAHPQYTAMLMNKLVNIDTEVDSTAVEYEREFKAITSGEPVTCNQKFIPTFRFNPYCKLVLSANIFPRITDHSSAFFRRLILIPCNRVFTDDEINIDLKDQLQAELPGIFNWSVIGLKRLNERKRFDHKKQFMVDAIAELREESNPIEVFFRECIEIDLSGHIEIEKSELYKKYCEWCKEGGNVAMSAIKFGKSIYQKYSKVTLKKSQNAIGKRVWKNLRYINQQPQGQQVTGWHEQ